MANEVEKLNNIALADIEKINGKDDDDIEKINGAEFSGVVYGPPAVVNTSVLTAGTGATSHTLALDAGTGVGRLLLVGICQEDSGASLGDPVDNPSGVTYDGQAMTRAMTNYRATVRNSVWYIIAPSTGSNNIVASFSGTTDSPTSLRGIALSGCRQDIAPGGGFTSQWGAGTSQSWNVDTPAGVIVMDWMVWEGSPTSESKAQGSDIGGAPASDSGGHYITATGSYQAMGWSWSGSTTSVQNAIRQFSDVYT